MGERDPRGATPTTSRATLGAAWRFFAQEFEERILHITDFFVEAREERAA